MYRWILFDVIDEVVVEVLYVCLEVFKWFDVNLLFEVFG